MSSVREYPPSHMTSNKETVKDSVYGNGEYTASSSSVFGEQEAWKAFDGKADGATDLWHSGTMIKDSKFKDDPEWVQLQLPRAILLKKYTIQARDSHNNNEYHKKDFPNKFQMKGSNNGTSWTSIDTQNDVAKGIASEFEKKEFTLSTTTPYKYFRLEVENVGEDGKGRTTVTNGTTKWTDSYVAISRLFLLGEEPDDADWVASKWPGDDECEEDPQDKAKKIMTRKVECKRGSTVVDDKECTKTKPDTTKECEAPFPWKWIGIGVGGFVLFMMMILLLSAAK